jgi:hypothetical protein
MNQNENSPWEYKPKDDNPAESDYSETASADAPAPKPKSASNISWQAAEFIEHPHNPSWYGSLVLITAALTALVYFVTKDYVATGTIPIVGIIVGVFAGHKPGIASYEISSSGLSINGKNYAYNLFKSFSVLREGSLSSVNLFPLKRFMPPVSAYFDPKDEPKIMDALGNYLPYEERQMDAIERLSRRLRL